MARLTGMLRFLRSLHGTESEQASASKLALHIASLERCLTENVASFWYPRSIDNINGGYAISEGLSAETGRQDGKALVSQARMVWFFSRLARFGYQSEAMLEAAGHGYRYLRGRMWDEKHGGFYWSVDAASGRKRAANKHLYGQAFGLFAISEYAVASGENAALDLATELFAIIESRAHDGAYGGYIEYFREDWTAPPARQKGYLRAGSYGVKLMNTHLHLLEAITRYATATGSSGAERRVAELLQIQANSVVRHAYSATTDRHQRDWTPILDQASARVSYGHDLENITLIADACVALELPTAPFQALMREMFDYSLRHGFDYGAGGFFDSGPLGKPADRRAKIWWVQAEAMLSALVLYKLTGTTTYFEAFEATWAFVERWQVDWKLGEWHHTRTEDGGIVGDKGSAWKAGYHTGRCLMRCIELLRELRAAA